MILRVLIQLGLCIVCGLGLEFNQEEIDSFINAALACRRNKNPGLTVSVVKDGKVMFAKGYGVTDVETRRPVSNTTLFALGSVSKAFTATLMVKLLHYRNMSVYTKPGDISKEGFEYAYPEYPQHVTIADLMTHRTGVQNHKWMRLNTNITRKDIARLWGVYAGSGGIMSTSSDVTKWMLMQLGEGRNQKSQEVIRPEDLRLTHFPHMTIQDLAENWFQKPKAPFSVTESNYALGWKIGTYKDWKLIRHTGTTYGYTSLITMVPGANLGIFTSMSGYDNGQITRILLHSYLSDIFLKEKKTINKTTVCSYPEPWFTSTRTKVKPIIKTNSPSRALSQYVGVYSHAAYGNLVISINSTIEKLQMDFGAGHWILYPEANKDKFRGEAFGLVYKIHKLDNVQFYAHTNNPDAVDVFDFEPRTPPRFTKIVSNSYHNEL